MATSTWISPRAPNLTSGETGDVLERFIREMHQLEGRMNFVGYSMLYGQWMLEWGLAWNEYECRKLIDEYQDAGIVERHEVANRNNPGLADFRSTADPDQRDGAPGAGVQRWAHIQPGAGRLIVLREAGSSAKSGLSL